MDAGSAWSGGRAKSEHVASAGHVDGAAPRVSRVRLAGALQSLGPVLCLYPAQCAQPLSGWRCWRRVAATIDIDSDGPWEALTFLDAADAVCWQLGLLPDADFFAWERLLDALAGFAGDSAPTRTCRQRRRGCRGWRACALRLFDCGGGELAASVPTLSPTGRTVAAQIAAQRRAQIQIA